MTNHLTPEKILKIARKRTVFVGKVKPQQSLRRECEKLASEGFLVRVGPNAYQSVGGSYANSP